MSVTAARWPDIPALAWIQAQAFTRSHTAGDGNQPGKNHDRDIPAALTFPTFLMATIEARAVGGLYHHNRQVTAYAKPPGISWRILGARTGICLLILLFFIVAVELASGIHPLGPLALMIAALAWVVLALWFLGRRAFTRESRMSEKTMATYARQHHPISLVNIARADTAQPGAGLRLTQELTKHLVAQGHTVALIAATPKHQSLYAAAGYTPIDDNLAMVAGVAR
ncbi:hypothetical protein ACTXMB_14440 [Arthrobacter rhombi]|uniref:hypothetical protein n=1 Tax=Arthrobacter rhombi TaxID=71253 RepID=UPI003FD085FA